MVILQDGLDTAESWARLGIFSFNLKCSESPAAHFGSRGRREQPLSRSRSSPWLVDRNHAAGWQPRAVFSAAPRPQAGTCCCTPAPARAVRHRRRDPRAAERHERVLMRRRDPRAAERHERVLKQIR